MIDMLLLQSFVAVAETASFTGAAERVGRTQSAISQQMAKLESYLGSTLLIRGKSVSLTTDGDVFLSYARQMLHLYRELVDRFKAPELEGELRFGLPEDFASVYLSDVLVDFSRMHPRVHLKIECDLTLHLFERFKRREFDLVLVKMSRPSDILNSEDVFSEKLEWVSNPDWTYDPAQPVPLIVSPQPCVYRAKAIQALESQGIKWNVTFSCPSYAGMVAAVKAGMGVSVLPKTMIPSSLRVLQAGILPELDDTHVCLLRHDDAVRPAFLAFQSFVLKKLRH